MASRRAFGSIERRKRKDGSYKPGFYAKFVWEGRRIVRSAGPDKAHARRKLDAAHGLLKSGVPLGPVLSEVFGDFDGTRLTFKRAAACYLEYAEKRKRATTFHRDAQRLALLGKESWSGEYLARITPERLARHVQRRMAKGASAGTVNRELSAVSAVFRWAVVMGYVESNPVRRVDRPSERDSGREVYLTAQECHALLDAAEGVSRDVVEFAIGTGCRRGEILALRWRSVRLGDGPESSAVQIEPESAKTGKGRSLPLTGDVYAMLKRRHARRPLPHLRGEDRVFVRRDGSPLKLYDVRKGFEAAKAAATVKATKDKDEALVDKLGRLRFHDLRHTAASLMVAAGVPIFDVGKILGHATVQMTMRYAHFVPEAGRAAMDALSRALARGA